MGNQSSRSLSPGESLSSIDLSEYERVCAMDPDVRKFGDGLKERTERVLQSMAAGVDERGLSFQSLKDVTTSFLELDQEVVNVILNYKKDVWASDSLFELVKDYFDNSMATLDFCEELNKCIKQARENQMSIQVAINMMPNEGDPSEEQCQAILKELNQYVDAGNPFTDEFMEKFQIVYQRQMELQRKLQAKKKSLDRKLRYVRGWTKVSTIIYAATCAALVICAVVAAVMTVPAIVGAVAAVSSMPLETLGRWIKSFLTKYEKELQARRDLMREANLKTFVTIKEMDTIRALINSLSNSMESIVHCIQFGQRHADGFGMHLVVEQLKSRQSAFIRDLDELEEHVDRCSRDIRRARLVVLRRIVKKRSGRIGFQLCFCSPG
ncbi:hypothetical protein SELMODRAFT_119515 [Selaginella moellendorffii]|uniref:Uncharacterized protein n=1 Tax=Selaginella moellendorffii TaxID=88036 RepID=D8SL00_SELML|nr:UPF0496 protein 1 [Selaginella moellendorffii]EFJ14938.1 hypothetical protein SELMODRAFT_119515 [Selaginella moellendorffii]|eukprot:XP_002983926.1 UPF0496 protein 1 [Selaginella moellendorffii]